MAFSCSEAMLNHGLSSCLRINEDHQGARLDDMVSPTYPTKVGQAWADGQRGMASLLLTLQHTVADVAAFSHQERGAPEVNPMKLNSEQPHFDQAPSASVDLQSYDQPWLDLGCPHLSQNDPQGWLCL